MKLVLTIGILVGMINASMAQAPNSAKKIAQVQLDSTILLDVVYTEKGKTAIEQAADLESEPDWDGLRNTIRAKYDEVVADRTITMAQIYYYFGKNWPSFSNCIIHYTNTYESLDDLKLINTNSKMILKYSTSAEEWKQALAWMKHVVEKDPSNPKYKETYEMLEAKIRG